jgi:hypothetical protein
VNRWLYLKRGMPDYCECGRQLEVSVTGIKFNVTGEPMSVVEEHRCPNYDKWDTWSSEHDCYSWTYGVRG